MCTAPCGAQGPAWLGPSSSPAPSHGSPVNPQPPLSRSLPQKYLAGQWPQPGSQPGPACAACPDSARSQRRSGCHATAEQRSGRPAHCPAEPPGRRGSGPAPGWCPPAAPRLPYCRCAGAVPAVQIRLVTHRTACPGGAERLPGRARGSLGSSKEASRRLPEL